MREQLQKQLARLRELRIKKAKEPGTRETPLSGFSQVADPCTCVIYFLWKLEEFYGTEDLAVHNVDVMTDASAFTAFTRYTAAPSGVSRGSTKRSSRSKRKQERKVGSGRKGTVDEEEYLLKSLTKLASRLATAQGTSRDDQSPPSFFS
jgi:elongator complex protein 1